MWRTFLSERERALQVLRQSDCACQVVKAMYNLQSEQRLLQPSACDQHIPFGVVESVHGGGCGRHLEEFVLASL